MIWVLIISYCTGVYGGSHCGIVTHEFNGENTCKAAAAQIKIQHGWSDRGLQYVCVEK